MPLPYEYKDVFCGRELKKRAANGDLIYGEVHHISLVMMSEGRRDDDAVLYNVYWAGAEGTVDHEVLTHQQLRGLVTERFIRARWVDVKIRMLQDVRWDRSKVEGRLLLARCELDEALGMASIYTKAVKAMDALQLKLDGSMPSGRPAEEPAELQREEHARVYTAFESKLLQDLDAVRKRGAQRGNQQEAAGPSGPRAPGQARPLPPGRAPPRKRVRVADLPWPTRVRVLDEGARVALRELYALRFSGARAAARRADVESRKSAMEQEGGERGAAAAAAAPSKPRGKAGTLGERFPARCDLRECMVDVQVATEGVATRMCVCQNCVCRRAVECAEAGSCAQGYELDPDSWTFAEDVEDGCQELVAAYNERTCKERTGLAGGSRA